MSLEENELESIKIEKIGKLSQKSIGEIGSTITDFFKSEESNEGLLLRVKYMLCSLDEDQKLKNEIFKTFMSLSSLRKEVNEKLCAFLEHISMRE